MRGTIITLCILFALVTPAYAGEWFTWDETNTKLQALTYVLLYVDMRQTIEAHVHNPEAYQEDNKFLGESPSKEEIKEYFAYSAIVTTAIPWILPPALSYGFQGGVITVEIMAIGKNYSIGIRGSF
jgi:hypothetical protein